MKTRRNMLIPDRLWDSLKKEAGRLGISVTALVIRVLDQYFEKKEG